MTRQVAAAGLQVEQRDATPQADVTAAGVQVEQRDATPQANVAAAGIVVAQRSLIPFLVMGMGLMVELQDVPYVRPESVTECAPEVDSAHSPVPLYLLGGDTVLAPEADSAHVIAPVILLGGDDVLAPNVDNMHLPVTSIVQNVTTVTILTPSQARQKGISLAIYQPTIDAGGYNPRGRFVRSIRGAIDAWSHTTAIDGGYVAAQGAVTERRSDTEDWIESGLGRHVEVVSDGGGVIWEGFVNQLNIKYGPLTYNIGPLLDIVNRLSVTYSPLDTTVDPPTTGATTETTIAQDTTSQLKYGILEAVLSGSSCTDTDAEKYRDTYLTENKMPKTSKDINYGENASQFGVSLSLAGYSSWLDKYIYTYDSVLFVEASTKVLQVLQAAPNVGMFSTITGGILYNGYLVNEGEFDRSQTAGNIIASVRSLGDVNDTRWTFGIWEYGKPRYEPKENMIRYVQRLSDPIQTLRDYSGGRIEPWEVVPGRWLYIEDFLPGRVIPVQLENDPRALYIEEVTFTHPFGLTIRGGGGAGKLSQWLAKQGLKGS